MNFEEALAYMEGRIRLGWKLGNARFEALCERLRNPQSRFAVVHVAGTKGKGSTTAFAAALLKHAGYQTGGYFSPYVYDVRERVQWNGEPISKDDFARVATEIQPHIAALEQTELGATTEFELKTAVAFCYFAERNADFAAIEVGIGGRLDATNVLAPTVCVITNIGLDHVAMLGDTHGKIAAEKAGIIKFGIPCVTAVSHPEALAVIETIARERSAPLTYVRRGDASQPTNRADLVLWQSDGEMSPITIATKQRVYRDIPVRMGGWYQRENAACAVAAIETALAARGVELSDEAVTAALAEVALPGRLTTFRLLDGPLIVLDGAHNGMAAEALARPLAELRTTNQTARTFLVMGMLEGHDPKDVLIALAPGADRLFVCQPKWKRALPAEALAEAASGLLPRIETMPSVEWAVRAALSAAEPNDLILITGSFYTVGEARPDQIAAWHEEIKRYEQQRSDVWNQSAHPRC